MLKFWTVRKGWTSFEDPSFFFNRDHPGNGGVSIQHSETFPPPDLTEVLAQSALEFGDADRDHDYNIVNSGQISKVGSFLNNYWIEVNRLCSESLSIMNPYGD